MQGDITFHGAFILDKPLTSSHLAYLEKFTGTDRYKRNSEITATRPDPIREAVNLPIGLDGAYFVGGNHCFSGKREEDIVSFMNPPKDHPSHLCYWTSNSDGSQITCNDCYFPKYKEWQKYIIVHFLHPWGYILNGEVIAQHYNSYNTVIVVVNNRVLLEVP